MTSRRAALIVLDGLGVGAAHDAAEYGDLGSATLGNVVRATPGLELPNLVELGFGHTGDSGLPAHPAPKAAWGTAQPSSPGKDSTTGHWELTGVVLDAPFPTYPDGFPEEILAEFSRRTGRGVLGNRASSGTTILDELAQQQQASGDWIVYTSADSVFQVAAHEELIPLDELYRACEVAREILAPPHGVSRVIARPFVGQGGVWHRTPNRRDFSLEPAGITLLDRLIEARIPAIGVGKVDDLFAGRGIRSRHTATNREAFEGIIGALDRMTEGFLFANVIEFDQSWGHRNDVTGFVGGLRELDAWIPTLRGRIGPADLVILTADHGNDPTTRSTDHAREQVPIVVLGGQVRPINVGERQSFADVGQTIAEWLGVPSLEHGTSFLGEVMTG
ncbi:MAG TPA: phosphopentomutase [Gemmatimonadales bacterium]|nr:phosphopentomutase [Gemmatimonadales bacterium]